MNSTNKVWCHKSEEADFNSCTHYKLGLNVQLPLWSSLKSFFISTHICQEPPSEALITSTWPVVYLWHWNLSTKLFPNTDHLSPPNGCILQCRHSSLSINSNTISKSLPRNYISDPPLTMAVDIQLNVWHYLVCFHLVSMASTFLSEFC